MNPHYLFVLSAFLFLSSIYQLDAVAAGDSSGNAIESPDTSTNTINTGTPSNLNTNTINQGVSAFSSSFSGYSSFGSQCGLSLSAGYINNNGNQDGYQLLAAFNTNPCANQSDLENIRQQNENKREVIRANANIITTCINARSEAAKNGINPDTICKLNEFQMPISP